MIKVLERTEPGDRYYDYCLWEYEPRSTTDGKLRSVSVLNNSIVAAGMDWCMLDLCDAIRADLGNFRTVWGVKQENGELSWEFYFYDYSRVRREVSIARVLSVLSPFAPCRLTYSERRPYFMFSIDFDRALLQQDRELDEISIYVGNMGSNVSSGICYSYSNQGLRLDNFYFFFDAHRERDEITGKVVNSAHIDSSSLNPQQVLWPELVDCQTIVVANKRLNDGIYFSRVTAAQLLFFCGECIIPRRSYISRSGIKGSWITCSSMSLSIT